MTLKELARSAELSVDYLNKLELGQHMPSAETLLAIAGALEVDISELFPDGIQQFRGKKEALDELRAFAAQFDEEEIRYLLRVARVIMDGRN